MSCSSFCSFLSLSVGALCTNWFTIARARNTAGGVRPRQSFSSPDRLDHDSKTCADVHCAR